MLTIQFISKISTSSCVWLKFFTVLFSWIWLWFRHRVFSLKSWKCVHISQNILFRCTTGIAKFLFQTCTISHVHVTSMWMFLICQMWLRGQLVTLPLSQTMLLEWIWKDLKWLSFNFAVLSIKQVNLSSLKTKIWALHTHLHHAYCISYNDNFCKCQIISITVYLMKKW